MWLFIFKDKKMTPEPDHTLNLSCFAFCTTVFCKVTPEQDFVSKEKIRTTVFREKEIVTLIDYKQGFIRAPHDTDNLDTCRGFH